ncbi:hypothetical protein J1614_004367, partial [Plenodomus biglobosus]
CLIDITNRGRVVDSGVKAICHCAPCQKRTASAFSMNLIIPREVFEFTKGVTRTYPHLGDSGKLYHHHFCGSCGVQVIGIPDAAPGVLSIKIGSLDPECSNVSSMENELYVVNRMSYLRPCEGLTQYDGMLPL